MVFMKCRSIQCKGYCDFFIAYLWMTDVYGRCAQVHGKSIIRNITEEEDLFTICSRIKNVRWYI